MYRTDKLVIRLSRQEKVVIDQLARTEYLPPSTLARKMLLKAAERRGLLPSHAHSHQEQQPQGASA